MRDGFFYSVLFHAAVLVVGYFGLPYIQRAPLLTDTPIMVEIVNVDEVTNAPAPKPKPPKKTEDKKKPPPPKKVIKTAAPPPPPPKVEEKEEVAALPVLKEKPKPKPKAEEKQKPKPRLAKAKPRRKPPPPDAFASVLKTVEKLKEQPPEKKKEEKKPKKKETFEQQMAKALTSRDAKHNPLRPLAISEIDLVRQQIRECWNLPSGAKEAQNLSIEIRMVMNPDGTVRQARILDQSRLQGDPFFRAAAESALRAVLNPRCNPLKLPPEKYQQWQNMILVFDPSQMF
ncbi:MAG: hypothetical protein HQ512_07645 [Rhodospirillales bacterium]|nr:hypothetical protein [Rhodospirillales bacterium]